MSRRCVVVTIGLCACEGPFVPPTPPRPPPPAVATAPRPAATGARFARASAGALHTCALTNDGTAYCWGRNTENELGRGTMPGNATVPAPVLTTIKFDSITAGGSHTCALHDGTAY